MGSNIQTEIECRTHNSRFAKAGVLCFYDSEVLNSSFVHLVKFSAKNPRLRKAAKRYLQSSIYETHLLSELTGCCIISTFSYISKALCKTDF